MSPDITLLLDAGARGDRAALDSAYAQVYGELKRIAQGLLRGRDDTLSPTVLVNEAYLRLCGGGDSSLAPGVWAMNAAIAVSCASRPRPLRPCWAVLTRR